MCCCQRPRASRRPCQGKQSWQLPKASAPIQPPRERPLLARGLVGLTGRRPDRILCTIRGRRCAAPMGGKKTTNSGLDPEPIRHPGADHASTDVNFASIQSLDSTGGWHVLRVSREGVVTGDVAAQKVLRQFFFDCPAWEGSLPAPLANAFFESRDWGLSRSPSRDWRTFSKVQSGMKLTANYIPDPSGGYVVLRSGRAVAAVDASALPLTGREKEIVTLVAAGKTNAEISLILAISARTVQKHLENMFRKLGVESRMALAMRATV
ncbi:MAG: hypothetical protein C0524_11695 [Rhodobacter sp.]|nr:hypothetical protein [Rhodobacter sp.]